MAANHHLHSRRAGIDVEFGEIVNDVKEYVADPDQFGLSKSRGPRLRIIIALDRNQRRHGREVV